MALLVDVEKRLSSFTLRVQLETEDGVLALLGASGCGKSMTLKCIAGIEKPDRGRIELDGRVLFDGEKGINLPPQKRKVGYLFQQYALFPNMTVRQNIRAGLRSRKNGDEIVDAMIRAMELEGHERKRPNRLSGGQQQRVALARILVNEPELLLLDEPFSALDSHLRFQMEQKVREVVRSFQRPVVLVSHDRDEVFRLSDRVAILNAGQVEMVGERAEVFRAPMTRSAAILTGCRNISPIRKLGEYRLLALDWGLELETAQPVGDARYVGIRGQELHRAEAGEALPLTVAEIIENPFSRLVLLRRADDPRAATLCWETAQPGLQVGEAAGVAISPEAVLLLKE